MSLDKAEIPSFDFDKQIKLLVGIEKMLFLTIKDAHLDEKQLRNMYQQHSDIIQTVLRQKDSPDKTVMNGQIKHHEEINNKMAQLNNTCAALNTIISAIDAAESDLTSLKGKRSSTVSDIFDPIISKSDKKLFLKLKNDLCEQKNKFLRGEISTNELNSTCSEIINQFVISLRIITQSSLYCKLTIPNIITQSKQVITVTLPEKVSIPHLLKALDIPKRSIQASFKDRLKPTDENDDDTNTNVVTNDHS